MSTKDQPLSDEQARQLAIVQAACDSVGEAFKTIGKAAQVCVGVILTAARPNRRTRRARCAARRRWLIRQRVRRSGMRQRGGAIGNNSPHAPHPPTPPGSGVLPARKSARLPWSDRFRNT